MASSSFVAHSLASIVSHSSTSYSFIRPTKNCSVSSNRAPTCWGWHGVRAKANGFPARSMSQDLGFDYSAVENMINPTIIPNLKIRLLSSVSGLNRGLAANEDDLRKADDAARELEDTGGVVDLSKDLEKLQGKWKLIYSSAFSSRTLGGSRPGPPTRRLLPITLGQVFQRIDILSKDFDNIVELELGAPWPLPPLEATATLAHKFELIGSAKIKIIFEKTTVKTSGNLAQLPQLEIPQIPEGLRPQSNRGTGDFEVTYLDADTRVTRGDRGELRVFVVS